MASFILTTFVKTPFPNKVTYTGTGGLGHQHLLRGGIQPIKEELHFPAHSGVRSDYVIYHDQWNVSRTNGCHFTTWSCTSPSCLSNPSKDVLRWILHQPEALSHYEVPTLWILWTRNKFPPCQVIEMLELLSLHPKWACSDRYKNWNLKVECYCNEHLNYVVLA